MIINFNTYNDMLNWPNPQHNDIGIVTVLQKSYTYNGTIQQWLCHAQDRCIETTQVAPTGATEWAPTINVNEFTHLTNISSDMTSLIITMGAIPDPLYYYEFRFNFETPSTLNLATFQVKDSNGTLVNWLGSAPSLVGGKTYEVSVAKNLAVIVGSV